MVQQRRTYGRRGRSGRDEIWSRCGSCEWGEWGERDAYLCVRGGAEALAFYTQAFGGDETSRITEPDGRLGHAEMRIGGSPIFLADEHPEIGVLSPMALGGSAVTIHLTVPDVDALFERAVAAGAQVIRPVADQGHGHRNGKLVDPFGHVWMLSSFTREE